MADPTPSTATSLAGIAGQARGLWQRLPDRARLGAIATLVGIMAVVAFLALRPGPGPWKPVINNLPPSDANELASALDGHGIPNRVNARGAVEVPAGEHAAARVVAADLGLPRSGEGWEVTSKGGLTKTSKQESIDYQRALEGELSRTIGRLDAVHRARVHIAFGKRSVFKDADAPPTASVVLDLRAGLTLTPAQVAGVKNLVAKAVDGMATDGVAVIDQVGAVLSSDERDGNGDTGMIEDKIAVDVRTLLERTLGRGKVAVVVKADLDRSKVTKSQELYDPGASVIRSQSTSGEPAAAPAAPTGGIVGVQGNLPGAPAAATGAAGAATGGAGTSLTNYEVSRTVTQTEEEPSRLKKLQVAILVDYRAVEGGDPEPLPKAELDELAAIARTAAGLDEARGDKLEIRSVPFAVEVPAPAPAPARAPLPVPVPVALGGVAALIAAVVVVIAARRRRRAGAATVPSTLALPAPIAEVERALASPTLPGEAPLPALPPERSLEERVVVAVRTDLPRAARVLASWLSEPDPVTASAPAKGGKAA